MQNIPFDIVFEMVGIRPISHLLGETGGRYGRGLAARSYTELAVMARIQKEEEEQQQKRFCKSDWSVLDVTDRI